MSDTQPRKPRGKVVKKSGNKAGARASKKTGATASNSSGARASGKAGARTARKSPARSPARGRQPPDGPPGISAIAVAALADMKAGNVKVIDVRRLTDVTDTMIVASGTSNRHVRSIADRVVERCKGAGFRPLGVEGDREGEWVLVDLQDVLVHVMLPRIREFYGLEKLWDVRPSQRDAALA